MKIDHYNLRRVEYHYDVDAGASAAVYGSRNNRLMWYETVNTAPNPEVTLSKTYYEYSGDGNPTRIITEHVGEGGSVSSAAKRGLRGGACPEPRRDRHAFKSRNERATAVSAVDGEGLDGGGDSSDVSTAAACGAGQTRYTAIRLGYARNGNAVTFAHDESWCAAAGATCAPPPGNKYAITWTREFRYDGARARYLDRRLNAGSFALGIVDPDDEIWTDYDGDEAYLEYRVTSTNPPQFQQLSAYEPGLWRKIGEPIEYLHNDALGTLRNASSVSGLGGPSRVYTSFGEQLAGTPQPERYGYIGAWGYQSHSEMPYLHIGARYYDPSSGRFLQRDPIGIIGGLNVHLYGRGEPTNLVDPAGLWSWPGFAKGVGVGVGTGAKAPGLAKLPGAIIGALICGIAGGLEKDDPSRLWEKVKETVDDYNKRTQPQPVPQPPANKTPPVFERPWDEKYRGPYSSGAG